ncbi:RagB/SusD family nutrient uptake outer membrane protein [Mucilaginibacter aquatilis]|uniref:RagB/SusD family nutrient uptake outer membrane protein n=1 Tax=Mucilaginibacter aquatilis TaxID=1517760 RepID=A0A6I4IR73_9SPHI|nr:RagB/SusD family nutrient uptake outer membrane protein [Mucilaginibacter aquatilis]MVN92983.1 RagB/SusD family nutrient uptake outer membrane protein [Mucilaginibacter aquatilis]
MNYKIFTYCLLLILISQAGCKKDFLQLDFGTTLPEDKVFSDPLLTVRFADNAYNFMIDDYARLQDGYKGTTGQLTDEATGAVVALAPIWSGNYLGANPDIITTYSRMYQGIRIINTVLTKLDQVPWTGSIYNPKIVRAQMLFLRGMFYFELVKRYGGVILADRPFTPTEDIDLPRNSYEQTVAFILNDLKEAEDILKVESSFNYSPANEWDAGNYGRPTVGAVKALRARLLMLDASPLHNPSGDAAKWNAAALASKEIIDMNKYALQSDYASLLNVNTSPEYIMIKVRAPRQLGGLMGDFIMSVGSGGAQGILNPTQNHVDLYEAVKRATPSGPIISSSPIADAGSGYNPQDPYANRDPRFYSNIIYNNMTWQGRQIQMYEGGTDFKIGPISYTRTRYYCRKLWPEIYKAGATARSLINYIYFRYAEVLLNYAEAQNESNGPTAEVYQYINQVRARAGMPGLPAGLSKTDMRLRIQNERGVEFAFEDMRWWDIMRWKKGPELVSQTLTAMNVVKNGNEFTYNVVPVEAAYQRNPFQERQYLYPIPLVEINKSRGVLVQNPGW